VVKCVLKNDTFERPFTSSPVRENTRRELQIVTALELFKITDGRVEEQGAEGTEKEGRGQRET